MTSFHSCQHPNRSEVANLGTLRVFAPSRETNLLFLTRSREAAKGRRRHTRHAELVSASTPQQVMSMFVTQCTLKQRPVGSQGDGQGKGEGAMDHTSPQSIPHPNDKSVQSGFSRSIRLSFQSRCQRLSCFSRAIAVGMSPNSSYSTSLVTPYRLVNPLRALVLC